MSRMRVAVVVAVAAAAPLAFAVQADAATAIQLISTSATEQADAATQPALSADGRYVAFAGSIDGLSGVFRKDLQTAALDLVAGGSAYVSGAPAADASAPSISADGRYVSFTTSSALDPAVDPGTGTSVYVRDMDVAAPPAGSACAAAGPCAYELASARDGSPPRGLTYASGGASAAGRVALSLNGREVAFETTGASDLGSSTPGVATTPAGQVVVRDLDTHATTLVSVTRDPASGAMTGDPVPDGAVSSGAALSGDGSTVAWLGAHVGEQVPLLSDEVGQIAQDDGASGQNYDEPLWRRIADGPGAPTRRMVGGGDPLAPGCPPGGTLQDAACQGPFPDITRLSPRQSASRSGWLTIPAPDGVPQLSADGRTAVLVGNPSGVANVFLIDMHDGLTRRQAVRQLTQEVPIQNPDQATVPAHIPGSGDVFDAAISSDGTRVAFATARSQFPLAPSNLAGSPLSELGLVELYRIDLPSETLERITGGPGGGPSLGPPGQPLYVQQGDGANSPSFSTDGRTLAFASTASNLVSGDGNSASDVFVTTDPPPTSTLPGTVDISPPPVLLLPTPDWKMTASATSLRDGRVQLFVVVPGAGTLRASASAVVSMTARVRRGASERRTRAVTTHPRHGLGHVTRVRRGRVLATQIRPEHAPAPHTRLVTRTVANGSLGTQTDGLVSIILGPSSAYRALAGTKPGIQASLTVTFAAPGHARLSDSLDVTFHAVPAAPAKLAKKSKRAKRVKGARRGRQKQAPRRAGAHK